MGGIWLDFTAKTASTNSSWSYIREGLLSEVYLRLRFGGLIFGRAYFFFGGGGGRGGAYYRNFTVFARKAFVVGLFSGELICGRAYWREFCVSKWIGLKIKTPENTKITA